MGSRGVDTVDDLMEFLATALIYAIFAVAAALGAHALYRRCRREVVEVGATLGLAFAGATALHHVSTQMRPLQTHRVHQPINHADGVSLPSDHATATFAIVGVHYPGDIAAALGIGVLAAAVVSVPVRLTGPDAGTRYTYPRRTS
jgi:undecaprenyl-diphosphatase